MAGGNVPPAGTEWLKFRYCPHCRGDHPELAGVCPRCRTPVCHAPGCRAACGGEERE